MDGYLIRYESTSDGCFGVMTFGHLILQTVEQPWLNNEPFHSCIPAGTYTLEPHNSPKHPNVWALVNLNLGISHEPREGYRDDCLIHVGNFVHDVEGCIAVGLHRSGDMVTNSKDAIELLRSVLVSRNTLTISFGVR